MARAELEAFMKTERLSIRAEFVPFSQSRNKAEKTPSLNWRVTLMRDGRDILTTDYSAGCAHAPGYTAKGATRGMRDRIIAWECEHGKRGRWNDNAGNPNYCVVTADSKLLQPDSVDVIQSLLLDTDIIDYANFERWAPEFGFNPDSKKDEAIYRLCLEHALTLRCALGEEARQRGREAGQDY